MKLIVGLGNPGREYADNRHNIGFMCLDAIAKKHRIKLNERQGKAKTGAGRIAGEEVVLAKPQTFMNLSGDAVAQLSRKYKVEPQDI
ncbi:MAG: aminoacyl-tRNA hydrolase, partial [Dehalococcoidia bacterium]|nr:aminoacyl-tRNA hydrolase [Dehalococcoidia bacterium]